MVKIIHLYYVYFTTKKIEKEEKKLEKYVKTLRKDKIEYENIYSDIAEINNNKKLWWKAVCWFPTKSNVELLCDPPIPLLGIYWK